MSHARPNCQRWMWIELLGFDNMEPDKRVQAFLDNAGFIPEVLSFHLCCPDFVHTYEGLEREVILPPDVCAYAGRPYNLERARQEWTNWQFKNLVEQLQQRGIQVYCSVMDLFHSTIDGQPYRSPWCNAHPELWAVRHTGEVAGSINPLKRMADGRYYEDFFVAKLRQLIGDYGFDGFHGADGLSSPRRPLWHSDYSDDMVEQFVQMMGGDSPTDPCRTSRFENMAFGAAGPGDPEVGSGRPGAACDHALGTVALQRLDLYCNGDSDRAEARARFIWANLRRAWCEFHARRYATLWTKICAAMRELGKRTAFNNTWTQEPFAAYYRYGIDYRRIVEAGVDTVILETVGAGNAIGAEGLPVELRSDMSAMLLFMKAALPDTPLMCLNCTGDTTENWDVLNHAPPVCEREHYSLGSLFLQDGRGFQHASAGPVVCLADGINAPQWRWMDRNWLAAYEKSPSRLLGPAILWSEAALAAEFADYVEHRALTRHKLCARLMGHGAPLLSVVRPEHLGQVHGPLLVPRPELLPADELQAVLAHPGTVVLIGLNRADLPPPDLSLAEGPDPEQLCLRVYRPERGATLPDFAPPPPAPLAQAPPEPPNYLYDLYFRPTSDAFLQVCAQLLIALSKTPPVINGVAEARVLAYQTAPGWVRLLIGNEAHYYTQPQLDLGRQLREVRIASHFPGKPIQPQGTTLIARVPPRGMVVLDVNVA